MTRGEPMTPIYTYTFSFFFIALAWFMPMSNVYGQEEMVPEENDVQDSIALAYSETPFAIQIGLDLLKLGSFALDRETKYEGQVGFGFKQVTLILEAGHAYYASALAYKNSEDYSVEGNYYRVGLDYAFNIGATSQIILGLRYGTSSFGHQGTFEVYSELWDNYITEVPSSQSSGATATWGEAVLGSQSHIGKNLYFGWYFRLRKILERTTYAPIDIYYIPGYGKSIDGSVPAVNLFLKYRIPF